MSVYIAQIHPQNVDTWIGVRDSSFSQFSTRVPEIAKPLKRCLRAVQMRFWRTSLSLRPSARRRLSAFDPASATLSFGVKHRGQRHRARGRIAATRTL